MKIAQIICTFPPYRGGMGNVVYHFSSGLADLGNDVTVLTPDYSAKNSKNNFFEDSKFNFKILRLKPLFKYGNAAFIPQLFWKLNNYDIVHLHYPFFGAMEIIVLLKLFFRKKFKLVVHYHMDAKAPGFKGLVFKLNNLLILPILLWQAKIITCASLDYIKHSNIANYYIKHSRKFRQTLFGVDLKRFTIQSGVIQEKNQKTILFVAGLDKAHHFKGLENLFQAIKILKNSLNIKFNLTIIGEGDLKDYYKNLAKDLEIDEIVNFLGQVDNDKLVDYYNYSDVFVLPSISQSEAFGLVLLEAMACAKPVIASNLPGVRGVFKNNIQGLLVEPKDVYDLAKKLKIILTNNNLARQMGQAGRKLVEDKYTWKKVVKRLDLIYNSTSG
ncbi:MAG: glycosyltransferase family 4 protein [bacterium]|nr:glycosyltransferase family 4 protein [bacterium]